MYRVWMNDILLTPGYHFDADERSTAITIRAQTFRDRNIVREGNNTVRAEFRENRNEANPPKFTVHNFYVRPGRPAVLLGDINGDGLVDVIDLLIMQRHFSGQSAITDDAALRAAKVTGGDYLRVADLIMLTRYIALWGTSEAITLGQR